MGETYTPVILRARFDPDPAIVGQAVTLRIWAEDILSTPAPDTAAAGEYMSGEA